MNQATSETGAPHLLGEFGGCHFPHMTKAHGGSFVAKLFKYPGPGGWHFVPVPDELTPPVTHAWGRTPVRATVDGHSWKTSVWRDSRSQRTLLAVPQRVRGEKGDGDSVNVRLEFAL